jgi:hypothetical protein
MIPTITAPATMSTPARIVRLPIASTAPTKAAAKPIANKDCVAFNGATTLTRPRSNATIRHT